MLPRIAVEVTCNSCDASTVVRTYRKFVRCPYCSSNIVFPGFSYKKIDHGSEKYSSVQYWMSCPSCREALQKLAEDPQWNDVKKLAVCLGYGPQPSVPGWDYLSPENGDVVFDLHMTPVYFVIAADGTVEHGYTLAL